MAEILSKIPFGKSISSLAFSNNNPENEFNNKLTGSFNPEYLKSLYVQLINRRFNLSSVNLGNFSLALIIKSFNLRTFGYTNVIPFDSVFFYIQIDCLYLILHLASEIIRFLC